MTPLTALWLPILLSAVFVFIVSSVIHMATPWHKSDYPRIPNEDAFRDAVRPLAIPPGDYIVPCPGSMQEMRSPEFKKKMDEGPRLMMTVFPNETGMAAQLVEWFIYSIVVGIFAGYIAGRALPPGSNYLQVFRFAGCTAFLGYSLALWQTSIWYRRSWLTTFKVNVDGLIYGLLTAGTFGWLWPR